MRSSFRIAVSAILCVLTTRLWSAEPARLPVIGEVWLSEPVIATPYMKAFRDGLRDQGYEEGRNVTIVSRFAEGDAGRLASLIQQLVDMKVDVLYVTPRAQSDAMRATSIIPIVSMGFADPVAEGFAGSLSNSGRNVTGISWQSSETTGKRLELATQLVPGLKRVALLFDPSDKRSVDPNAFVALARGIGVKTATFAIRSPQELDAAFRGIAAYRPGVLVVSVSPLTLMLRNDIYRMAASHRIASISEGTVMAEAGALVTYGPDELAMTRRTAVYVDKILKGAKPEDLPIEQPTKLQLIVNLKRAASAGMRVPDELLSRADRIIRADEAGR